MQWHVFGKPPQKLKLNGSLSKKEEAKLLDAVEAFRKGSGLRDGIPVAKSTCDKIKKSFSQTPVIIDYTVVETLSRWYHGKGDSYKQGIIPAKNILKLLFPEKTICPNWMTTKSRREPGWELLWKEWLKQFIEEEEDKSIEEFKDSLSKTEISETEKYGIVKQRINQGLFRKRVLERCGSKCVVTSVEENPENQKSILIASHIIAWNADENKRLDAENGLLLAPHIDKLFDSHLISFDENGKLIYDNGKDRKISIKIKSDLEKWGVNCSTILDSTIYTPQTRENMDTHRKIFYEKL